MITEWYTHTHMFSWHRFSTFNKLIYNLHINATTINTSIIYIYYIIYILYMPLLSLVLVAKPLTYPYAGKWLVALPLQRKVISPTRPGCSLWWNVKIPHFQMHSKILLQISFVLWYNKSALYYCYDIYHTGIFLAYNSEGSLYHNYMHKL